MMNEIDDIFKEAAQSEQATFKPEYWEQYAEQFSQEKKKRKGVFGFFLTGIIAVSGIGFFAYQYNSPQDYSLDKESNTVLLSEQVFENKNTEEQLQTELTSAFSPSSEVSQSVLLPKAKDKAGELNSQTRRRTRPNNSSKTSSLSLMGMLETGEKKSENEELSAGSTESIAENEEFSLLGMFDSESDSEEVIATVEETENNTNESTDENSQNSEFSLLGMFGAESEEVAQKQTNNETSSEDGNVISEMFGIDNDENNESLALTKQTKQAEETKGQESQKEQSEEEEGGKAVSDNTQDSALASVAEPTKKSSFVTTQRMKKLRYNLQFGGIVYNDFSLSTQSQNIKSSLFAGLEVDYELKPNLSISLGVNGYNRKSEGLYINFEGINNGFGEVISKKTYSYTQLYFVEVPVNLNYTINQRHRIGAGPVLTRLLTTKVVVEEETKPTQDDNFTNERSEALMYHYNTFVLNNLGVNITYQFSFRRIALNLGYTHGINEFLNKKTFMSSQFNSLNKLNVSIKYRL